MLVTYLSWMLAGYPWAPNGAGHGPDGEVEQVSVVALEELGVGQPLDEAGVDLAIAVRVGASETVHVSFRELRLAVLREALAAERVAAAVQNLEVGAEQLAEADQAGVLGGQEGAPPRHRVERPDRL